MDNSTLSKLHLHQWAPEPSSYLTQTHAKLGKTMPSMHGTWAQLRITFETIGSSSLPQKDTAYQDPPNSSQNTQKCPPSNLVILYG
eukprot:CCRYP_021033-RA/>CCRYP_021033-RA protein AED:0.48 eAED:1.00 QI:0/-1/0/1/-1/0/1/0/85